MIIWAMGYPFKYIFSFLFIFLLSSCGLKELAVKNADTFLIYQINKHLPLESKEKELLKSDVRLLLNNIKPEALELLQMMKSLDLEDQKNVSLRYEEAKRWYQKIFIHFSQLISKKISTLSKDGIKNFKEIQDKEIKKLKAKAEKKDFNKNISAIKKVIGDLNESQIQVLKKYEDYLHEKIKQRLERRAVVLDEVVTLLKRTSDQKTRETEIMQLFLKSHIENLKDDKYLEIILAFLPTLNEKQKKHLHHQKAELTELIEIFIATKY
jgi:hypothetical protein